MVRRLAFATAAFVVLAACGGDGEPSSQRTSPSPSPRATLAWSAIILQPSDISQYNFPDYDNKAIASADNVWPAGLPKASEIHAALGQAAFKGGHERGYGRLGRGEASSGRVNFIRSRVVQISDPSKAKALVDLLVAGFSESHRADSGAQIRGPSAISGLGSYAVRYSATYKSDGVTVEDVSTVWANGNYILILLVTGGTTFQDPSDALAKVVNDRIA